MSRTRFNIFNAEEFDDTLDVGGDAEVSATDSIEAETQAIEMEEDVAEVEEVMASTEEAEEVADELTEQVEEQEKVIEETPEEVTEDTVALAQEAFFISISKIGALKDYKELRGSLGIESAGTPLEKLKLTCEGVWEFIKALIERIKIAFLKVGELIKKLYIKFLVFFTNLKKKAEALSKSLKDVDGNKTVTLNDDQVERVTKTFKCFLAAGVIKSTKDLDKVVEDVLKTKTNISHVVGSVKLDMDIDNLKKSIDPYTKLAQSKNANVICAPYYVNSTIKAIVVDMKSDTGVKYDIISIDNDDKVDTAAPTATELKNILGKLAKSENGLKELVETAKKTQETFYKNISDAEEEIVKNQKFGAERMKLINVVRLIRRLGTNVLLDGVLNYVYNMKNVLAISAMVAKELLKK